MQRGDDKCPANTHSEATLTVKLNIHGEGHMNALLTRDKDMLATKLNARNEVAYECSAMHAAKLHSNELDVKH